MTALQQTCGVPQAAHAPPPAVSICIANYNGRDLLGDCIASIRTQTTTATIEILVHDDASTDESVAYLEAHHPDVRLITSASNVGFCIANNRMVAAARGEHMLLLNNDAALFPDAVATLLQAASQPGPPRILSLPQYDWTSGDLVDRGCLLDPLHVPVPNLDPAHARVAYVIGACLWMASADWRRLGGLPEWMESIGEDLFLCAKARLAGMEVRVVATSGYRHRQGASFGGNRVDHAGLATNFRRRRLSERNRAAVLAVCTPGPVWMPWLAVHAAALAAEAGALCVLKRSIAPWREVYGAALAWLWRNRSLLGRVRDELQSAPHVGLVAYASGAYTWRLRKLTMLMRHGVPKLSP